MADPLSFATSLVAVARVSGGIISLCYEYRKSVKGAEKTIVQVPRETQSMRNVIEQLVQLLDESDYDIASTDEKSASMQSIRSMCTPNGLVSDCQNDPQGLEEKLRVTMTKRQKLGTQLLWPLRERDVMQALESIHRMKSVVEFGLIADATVSVVEIHKNTRDLRDRMSDYFSSTADSSEQEELQVFLDWMAAPTPSTDIWICTRSVQKTRESGFWMKISSCGKSVLSSIVIQHIRHGSSNGRDTALAYFYFDFNNRKTSTADAMLQYLISQLLSCNGKIHERLKQRTYKLLTGRTGPDDAWASRVKISEASIDDFLDILRAIVNEYADVTIVLDAPDECVDMKGLLTCLEPMLFFSTNGLRIFLSSRPIPELSSVLEAHVTYTMEAGGDNISHDIETFIHEQLTTHPKLQKWPIKLRNEIQDSLIKGAKGMFRWADCQLQILTKCVTIKDVKRALQQLPKSLSDTYKISRFRNYTSPKPLLCVYKSMFCQL